MSKRTSNFRSSTSSSGKSKQFDVNSVLDRTPLSNISNVIDTGERRRIRKRILESKRSKNRTSSSNVGVTLRDKENSSHVSNVTNQIDMTIPFQRSVDATLSSYINNIGDFDRIPLSAISTVIDTGERRSIRKAIIDKKKGKKKTSTTNVDVGIRGKENVSQVSNVTHNINTTIPLHGSLNGMPALLDTNLSRNDNLQNNDVSLCTPGVYSINSNILTYTNSTSTSNRTSLSKLSASKRKLKHKARDLSPVVMQSLESGDPSDAEIFVPDPYKGISSEYMDHGDQVVICDICHAKLWTSEGGKGRLTLGKLCYGLCCGYGKVELPHLKEANPSYKNLFHMSDQRSKFFLKNIRRYNCMFSFTSMGGKVDSKINKGNAPFIYRISGQNFHSLGSLKPANGKQAKFSQLYIYDTENEVYNRQSVLGQHVTSHEQELDVEIIEYLKDFLDSHNELVKSYRMVRNHFQQNPGANLKLRLIYNRDKDGRTYNLPSSTEVAALIVDDLDASIDRRDIFVETQSGMLKRISELHPSYLALQYPIFSRLVMMDIESIFLIGMV
ncbi:uncharacterized protein LOC110901288 [Helianthus annuus]|uniref:uncharacterized protein LOC110901288 n=1 Tax=Helianthus annuus TaxID=4232 RepID=UPI000B8FC2A2|nr:uncharacterized protein LOC110901288 [Helianthus annuus]